MLTRGGQQKAPAHPQPHGVLQYGLELAAGGKQDVRLVSVTCVCLPPSLGCCYLALSPPCVPPQGARPGSRGPARGSRPVLMYMSKPGPLIPGHQSSLHGHFACLLHIREQQFRATNPKATVAGLKFSSQYNMAVVQLSVQTQ